MPNTILAVFGDTQIGSSTALAPPKFTIHNNDKNETQVTDYNRLQAWIWECWNDYWDYIKHLAGVKGKRRTSRIIAVHMGDVIDGNHHGTTQIIQDVADQIIVAKDVLEPIADMADYFFGVLGTEAHDGKNASDANEIYKHLDADDIGQNLTIEIDGKIHDFAHHGRIGQRPWTTQAAAVGVETIMDYASSGTPLPNFIWRAHNHVIDDSGDKLPGVRVITIPSWQLKTTYAHRISANRVRSDIGGYIVNNGLVDSSKSRYFGQPNGRNVIRL